MATTSSLPTGNFAALRTYRDDDGRVETRLERTCLDTLTPGDVVLRNAYAGINYKDCLSITGRARIISRFPRIAGIEAVGEVVASTSDDFAPGTMAMVHGFQTGIDHDGGLAEFVRVPAAHLQRVPDGLSPFQAALLGVPGFTVAMALERFGELGVAPGDGVVAVSGASGAVGLLAIAILSRAGYRVAALTRQESLAPALRALGAAEIVDTSGAAASTRPLEAPRFAAAIDNVGGPVLSWLLRSLRDGGCVASVGNAGGNTYEGSVLPFIMRRAQLFGVVANAPWPQRRRLWTRLADDWRPDFDALVPWVHRRRLDEVPAHALRQLDGATSGRALVCFDGAP